MAEPKDLLLGGLMIGGIALALKIPTLSNVLIDFSNTSTVVTSLFQLSVLFLAFYVGVLMLNE
jgi:hypothetical protein